MNIRNLFTFKKDNSQPENKVSSSAVAGLYNEMAINELVTLMTKVPDIDEVLKQANVRRSRLSVLLYDDEISQATETRLDALQGLNLHLEPTESAQSEFIQEQIKPILRDVIAGAFQARLYGYSVMEVVYKKTADNKIGLAFVGEKPMDWFAPRPEGTLLYFKTGYSTTNGEEVDQQFKFMLTRNRATYANPYGEALLSRLYWPWFFRQNGWKFWGKFLERFGSPLLVGKSTDPTAMVTALLSAHSQAVMGIDREDDVSAIGPSGGNNGAAFDQFETAVIRRIQKVILGQTLTSGTDGGSGNRALGSVHNNVRSDKLDSDIKLVLPTIQRIVDALCILNGFDKIEAIYSTETSLEDARAKRDKDLYSIGVRFNESYFQDNYKLSKEDFTMTTNADPAAQTPTDQVPANDKTKVTNADQKKIDKVKASIEWLTENLFSESAKTFTKNQQMLEDIADESLTNAGKPFDPEQIKSAVFAATDPADLEERLMVLFEANGFGTREQFSQALEDALRQAEIVGFVQSEVK